MAQGLSRALLVSRHLWVTQPLRFGVPMDEALRMLAEAIENVANGRETSVLDQFVLALSKSAGFDAHDAEGAA